MKIGILTPYDSSNIGAFLQAYAMKTALEDMQHEVKFIKLRDEEDRKRLYMGSIKNIKSFVLKYRFNKQKYKLFSNAIKENFSILPFAQVGNEKLDGIIIGSDEVWNVKKEFYQKECFYGKHIEVKKKIAYAISSGTAIVEDYLKYPHIVQAMKDLKYVYPRDEQTQKAIETLTDKQTRTVLDPTFLVDLSKMDKKAEKTIGKAYILVYGYSFTRRQRQYIKRLAKEMKCITVSVCMKCNWCDKNINCTPLEFVDIIRHSKYFITKTFHGSIFAILSHKSFVTFLSGQKVTNLLTNFGLADKIIDETKQSYEAFKQKAIEVTNYDFTDAIIKQRKEESLEVLKQALEN